MPDAIRAPVRVLVVDDEAAIASLPSDIQRRSGCPEAAAALAHEAFRGEGQKFRNALGGVTSK